MVPQHLRLLTYFVGRTGWSTIDLRSLSLATGIDYRHMVTTLGILESSHLLDIEHGRSDADPEGAKSNSYRLTDRGRAVVPEILRQPLRGNFALNHPMWSYKGYNLHGLVVALTLGPGQHEVTSATIAKILGTDRRSAVKRLAYWAEKGWASRLDRSTYVLWVPEEEPEASVFDLEMFVPEKAQRSADRKAAFVAQSRAAKKVVAKIIEEVGHWIPAAMAKVREAGIAVMEEFLDAVVSAPLFAPAPIGLRPVTMEDLRRRGRPSGN